VLWTERRGGPAEDVLFKQKGTQARDTAQIPIAGGTVSARS
jgi:hypothetical protein